MITNGDIDRCFRKTIGRKFKRLRYTQFETARSLNQVANDTGINKSFLSRIEKGQRLLSYPKMIELLQYYNVSFEWMFYGDIQDTVAGAIPQYSGVYVNSTEAEKAIAQKLLGLYKNVKTLRGICVDTLSDRVFVQHAAQDETGNESISIRITTLTRIAYQADISLSWLLEGDIADIDNGTVPKWESRTDAICTC
jgi:transcriptional regulator with XRE-family HTH domain